MFADITNLVIVSLEIDVSEDMKIKNVKMNTVKFNPVFLDTQEVADSFLGIAIASLGPIVSSSMTHLFLKKVFRKLKI